MGKGIILVKFLFIYVQSSNKIPSDLAKTFVTTMLKEWRNYSGKLVCFTVV